MAVFACVAASVEKGTQEFPVKPGIRGAKPGRISAAKPGILVRNPEFLPGRETQNWEGGGTKPGIPRPRNPEFPGFEGAPRGRRRRRLADLERSPNPFRPRMVILTVAADTETNFEITKLGRVRF